MGKHNKQFLNSRITIHITTKDRHTELYGVLQCLRNQNVQRWDLIILDDASGSQIISSSFIMSILNRIKLEGHKVKLLRNEKSFGCCHARNMCIDNDDFQNEYTLRLDDDILFNPTYIEELFKVIDAGYDMASGVIPLLNNPEVIRENKFIGDTINKHEFDKKGNLISQNDDCGFCYLKPQIFPTHQFRTNCLYKSKIHNSVKYPDNLTAVAFREEGFFSFGALIKGYKIGVNTAAVCYHLQTPSGGNRRKDYAECVKLDNETFLKWAKKKYKQYGDFLKCK